VPPCRRVGVRGPSHAICREMDVSCRRPELRASVCLPRCLHGASPPSPAAVEPGLVNEHTLNASKHPSLEHTAAICNEFESPQIRYAIRFSRLRVPLSFHLVLVHASYCPLPCTRTCGGGARPRRLPVPRLLCVVRSSNPQSPTTSTDCFSLLSVRVTIVNKLERRLMSSHTGQTDRRLAPAPARTVPWYRCSPTYGLRQFKGWE
jgi:hypothetical protein